MQLEHARCQKNALAIALASVEIDYDPHGHQLLVPTRRVNGVPGCPGGTRYHGDDQQLAAIRGGVLRDFQAIHGADGLTRTTPIPRPSRSRSFLALRDGRPEALSPSDQSWID